MTGAPDDLEKLLSEVHKTISDNKKFLRSLTEESVDEEEEKEKDEEPIADPEEFEEL